MDVTIQTERLSLAVLDDDEMRAIRAGERDHRHWAPDYPGAPELLLAEVAAHGPGGDASEGGIWGPWQIRLSPGGPAIGAVGVKGPPDDNGDVEIGYSLVGSARGHGYATEAVLGLINAIRSQAGAVTAETAAANAASQRVLMRVGFSPVAEGRGPLGPAIWWRLELLG